MVYGITFVNKSVKGRPIKTKISVDKTKVYVIILAYTNLVKFIFKPSNIIGSLSLANVVICVVAGVNFCFAVVTEEEILKTLAFLEYTVLSPSLYMLIQLFSELFR